MHSSAWRTPRRRCLASFVSIALLATLPGISLNAQTQPEATAQAKPQVKTVPETDPPRIAYADYAQVAKLRLERLRESSGMATSRANASFFWTHNDSGDRPNLYAFTFLGKPLAIVRIEGAKNIDWEDITCFQRKGKPYIVIGDFGDNRSVRDSCQLYLVNDNAFQNRRFADSLPVARKIEFRYEGGSRDCESIAYDQESDSFILVSKSFGPFCDVFQLKFPEPDTPAKPAERIGRLKLAGFTSIDISPDSRRAIGLTYAHAYEFVRKADETWTDGFRRSARRIKLPTRKQGEGICYGADGITIYTSSEGREPPLIKIAPIKDDAAKENAPSNEEETAPSNSTAE